MPGCRFFIKNDDMDKQLTNKIKSFLAIEKPTDEDIRAAATMLLQCDPRSRAIYNTAQRRPQAVLPWIRTDLKKHLGIRSRGLTRSMVPAYNAKAIETVDQTLSVRPSTVVVEKNSAVPVTSVRKKREDHDSLPEDIKNIWDRNAERWKKMRQLRTQLQVMAARPDYQACDGNELCYMLLEADTAIRSDYARYDGYDGNGQEKAADNVKAAGKARTAISRALQRKKNTEKQLEDLQDAVNILVRLGGTMKDTTIAKLKALAINVPDA